MDIWSKEKRSEVMSKIRSKDTHPEKLVRSLLHNLGYRFRLHNKDLPGNPDITLKKYKAIILVHGCFWHVHKACREGKIFHRKSPYWKARLNRNVKRDKENIKELKKLGWKVCIIWECEINKSNKAGLIKRIKKFLS